MKLHKIHLENVYGHRSTTLDLSDVESAVVCGDNGAGKSTLVAYGPLFALYGTKQGDTYADVVRHGADQATAEVTFEIGGTLYRVSRTYSMRTTSGSTDLEFVRRQAGDWVPEQTGSVREIESAIESLLGVSETTMRTGSIQCQGEGGRFTTARSSKRIEQLSALLGVEHLRDAYTEAGRLRRSADDRLDALHDQIEEGEKLEERLSSAESDLTDAEEELDDLPEPESTDDLDDKLKQVTSDKSEIDDALDDLDRAEDRREKLQTERTELTERLHELKQDRSELTEKRKRYDDQADLDDVHGLDTVDKARRVGNGLDAVLDDAEEASDQIDSFGEEIDDVQTQRRDAGKKIDRLWDKSSRRVDEFSARLDDVGLPWIVSVDVLRTELGEVDGRLASLEDAKDQLDQIESDLDNLEETADTIDERNDDVPEEDCRDCGLLQHAFDARDRLDDLSDQRDQLLSDLSENYEISDPDELTDAIERLGTDRKAIEDAISVRNQLDSTIEKLQSTADTYQEQDERVDDLEGRLDDLRDRWNLDSGDDPVDVIESQLEGVREAFTVLQKRDKAESKLEEIDDKIEGLDDAILEGEAELEEISDELDDLEDEYKKVRELREKRSDIQDQIADLQEKRADLQESNEDRREAIADQEKVVARIESKVESLEKQLDEYDDLEDEADSLKRESSALQYVRKFFDVAPSLVIGSAIPRLESTANDVLDDIFPEVRLRIERQKTSRSGTTSDKLHLRIVRNGTSQPFESFSGGEQFLLNIAVRLGLAKAASTRQSGRPIRLLIVDEGFGALDPDNTEQVKDALLKLSQRFAQVLVISHVPEVQGALGTLVRVEQTADGTNVDVTSGHH